MYIRPHELPQTLFHMLAEGSWDWCRSGEVVSQHARIIFRMVRWPVCHYSLSRTKQRRAAGATPGHFGCAAELMSIVLGLVRAWWQPFVQIRITTTQDTSQKGSVGVEEISSNSSWNMFHLKPSVVMQQAVKVSGTQSEERDLLLRLVGPDGDKNRIWFAQWRPDSY